MVNHKWSNCKSLLTAVFILLFPASVFLSSVQAQTQPVFSGHIENKEYGVYIYMDFYHSAVTVPGQELFGEVAGYLGQTTDSRKWIVLEAEVTTPVTAQLTIVNDYGSEDLTATLTLEADGTYTLHQTQGSALKIVANKKWVKLPKRLTFTRPKTAAK